MTNKSQIDIRRIAMDGLAILGVYLCFITSAHMGEKMKLNKLFYDGKKNTLKSFPLLLGNIINILISLPFALRENMNFGLLKNKKDGKKSDKTLEIVTLVISIVGLVIESIAGFFQQEVRAEINPSTFQLMFLTSFFIGLSSLVVWVSSGEVYDTVALYSYSIQAFYDQLMVSGLSCLGNIFVFMLLSRRGPIAVALVTTTRKVFSVLLSIQTGSEVIAPLKGAGIAIVVLGVILESLSGILSSKPHNQGRQGNHHHSKKHDDETKAVETQTDKQPKANGKSTEPKAETKSQPKKDR